MKINNNHVCNKGTEDVSSNNTVYFCPQVLGPETSQREMFDGTVRSLVKDVLEGGNSLVFTYGVTNAGKTFTFLGLISGLFFLFFLPCSVVERCILFCHHILLVHEG